MKNCHSNARTGSFIKMLDTARKYRIEINSAVAERELLQNKILFVSSTDDLRKRHKKEQANSEMKMRIDMIDLYIKQLKEAYARFAKQTFSDLKITEGDEMARAICTLLFKPSDKGDKHMAEVAGTDLYHIEKAKKMILFKK